MYHFREAASIQEGGIPTGSKEIHVLIRGQVLHIGAGRNIDFIIAVGLGDGIGDRFTWISAIRTIAAVVSRGGYVAIGPCECRGRSDGCACQQQHDDQ